MSQILILGSVPPPIGGVAIHLERLLLSLKDTKLNYLFIDYRKQSLKAFKFFLLNKNVHINFSNKALRFFVTLLGYLLDKRIIVTFHGKYDFLNILDRCSLKLSYKSFVLNKFSYKTAVKFVKENHVSEISAFIPPIENKLTTFLKADLQLNEFVSQFKYIFCTNSHNFVLDKTGRDLYGIDIIIEAIKDFKECGLIISDPSGKLSLKYSKVCSANIYFISYIHSFIEVINKSNCVIRATTTDGDSLSVKEALFFKKNVIASDCVDRVEGVVLFRTGDLESLKATMGIVRISKFIQNIELQNGAIPIINYYNSLIVST